MPLHVVQQIEAGRFDELPQGIFTRGYLRAFAREVGLDPEEIVGEYRREFERSSPGDESLKLRKSYADTDARTSGAALMLTIALAAIAYFAFMRPAATPPETNTAVETAAIDVVDASPAIEHAVAPAQTGQPAVTSPAGAKDVEGLRLELRPKADCWVSATVDGRLVIYRLMHGGEQETIDAVQEILLRVGDAGALAYAVNGGTGRSLGAPGEAVTVRITTDNAATWLTKEPGQPAA